MKVLLEISVNIMLAIRLFYKAALSAVENL